MTEKPETPTSAPRRRPDTGWLFVIGLALLFSAWGTVLFLSVGSKGAPPWDFSVIPDIPGEAPTSTARVDQFSIRTSMEPLARDRVVPQHVDRPHREWEVFEKVQRNLQ